MSYAYTTQRQIRAAFWEAHTGLECQEAGIKHRRTVKMGDEMHYNTDTRCAFVDYVDSLEKSGHISAELAERVTL